MRFKKSLKNGFFGMIQQVVIMLLAFLNRTVFVSFLGMEFLGYTTLFSNVFSWLSFVDAGFSSVLSYKLYRAVAQNNKQNVSAIMLLYQKVFRVFGVLILILGVVLTGAMPYIIRGAASLKHTHVDIYWIYWLQLLAVAVTYFASYWRAYIQAVQDEYICTNIDSVARITVGLMQIAALIYTKNIYVYLGVNVIGNLGTSGAIALIKRIKYPNAIDYKATPLSTKDPGLWTEIKDFMAHKLSYMVYGATDTILISIFWGATTVAQYGNYTLIGQYTSNFLFSKIFNGMQASLGNYINTESLTDQAKMFKILDVIEYIFASTLCCGYIACFQATVQWWMGAENLLPNGFLLLYIITLYFTFDTEILCKFRIVYGNYAFDKKWMITSAIVNLLVSIVLVQRYGVLGVQIGTIIGLFFIIYGRAKMVFLKNNYLSKKKYFVKHCIRTIGFALQAIFVILLTQKIPVTFLGIIAKGAVSIVISVGFNALFLIKSADGQAAFLLLKEKLTKERKL